MVINIIPVQWSASDHLPTNSRKYINKIKLEYPWVGTVVGKKPDELLVNM